MFVESITLANTLAGLPRALSEDEHAFYNAALRVGATMLRTCELEARCKEILQEKQYDELHELDGDSSIESV